MIHDLGFSDDNGSIPLIDKPLKFHEKQTHALLVYLSSKALITTDELRRGVEALEPESYRDWGYYDRWNASMTSALLERGTISEVDLQLYWGSQESLSETPSFMIGQSVQVVDEDKRVRWRKPHLRIPGYIHGCKGIIDAYLGHYRDPFLLAYRSGGDNSVHPKMHLYRVLFFINDIEKSRYYSEQTNEKDVNSGDSVSVDIFETWLENSPVDSNTSSASEQVLNLSKNGCDTHEHDHNHAHENDHHDHHHHDHHHVSFTTLSSAVHYDVMMNYCRSTFV
jgi:hypothetical protein